MAEASAPVFVFPGGIWHRVPLDEPAATERAVDRIVRAMTGTSDAVAKHRIRLREELGRTVASAAQGATQELYLAEQVTTGMPVTATLAVSPPTPRLSPSLGTDASAVMDVFLEGRGLADDVAARAARFRAGESEAFREVLPTTVVDGTPMVAVRFWVTVPGTKTIVPLQFASPFVDLATPLVTLFTAIVASVRWPQPVVAADAVAEDG